MAAVERHGRERGSIIRLFRHRRNQEAARVAEEELRMFRTGEPSQAFYPPSEKVIFLSERYKGTIASKKDMKERIREQNETCATLYYLGQMTPQWNRYMFNHLEEVVALLG